MESTFVLVYNTLIPLSILYRIPTYSTNLGDLCAMPYTNRTCLNCSKKTSNKKFCSRSCSSSFNNRKSPKIKRTKRCANCTNKVTSQRKYCEECKSEIYNDWNSITIEDIKSAAKYQKASHIRENARRIFKNSNKPKKCYVCGYDKHVHICHKKAIKSFDPKTPISVVNDISNLVALCPNHHWEFDNELLIIS